MSSRFRNVVVAAAVMVAAGAGCTDARSPVAPESQPAAGRLAPETPRLAVGSDLDPIARFRQQPQVVVGWAKTWIGPAGGRLDFYGFTIVVPPGAVDKVTMFTIRLPLTLATGSDRVVAEFEPHGRVFLKPVTIGFPYRGTSIDGDPNATVVWWDGSAWENMGGTISADGTQVFSQVPHFSEYGTTTTSRSGGMSISGG